MTIPRFLFLHITLYITWLCSYISILAPEWQHSNKQAYQSCPVYFKPSLSQAPANTCTPIDTSDSLNNLAWLITAPDSQQEDETLRIKSSNCTIWSVRTVYHQHCVRSMDSLVYERVWRDSGCRVAVVLIGASAKCANLFRNMAKLYGIYVHHNFPHQIENVDILRINDQRPGSAVSLLADWYTAHTFLPASIKSISLEMAVTSESLFDTGYDTLSAHSWHMWAAGYYLQRNSFVPVRVGVQYNISCKDPPVQYAAALQYVGLNGTCCYTFDITLVRRSTALALDISRQSDSLWNYSQSPSQFLDLLPPYCSLSAHDQTAVHERKLRQWVQSVLQWRCNLFQTAVACYDTHHADPFIPCLRDVQTALVEDYAWSKGWCDANDPTAAVPALQIPEDSSQDMSTSRPKLILYDKLKRTQRVPASPKTKHTIRLAFFMTVYKEPDLVIRILKHLYSPRHLYVIHVDAAYPTVHVQLTRACNLIGPNIQVVSALRVVYMASTASQLVSRAMMWFLQHSKRTGIKWDYFISCTGSDYPLLPLHVMEGILAAQRPPMPRLMNWSPSTWKDSYQRARQSPQSSYVRDSINLLERRGSNSPAARRATEQFGVPLTCGNQKAYVRLNARVQAPTDGKEGRRGDDSEWLFGRSKRKDRHGIVNAEWDASYSSLPRDGVFRVWCKSDPGTTAVYDYESVNYIVNSIEGRKYFHFFKNMLLGSEEHYFISLLANWERTRYFVNTYDSQSVWNSWMLGSLSSQSDVGVHSSVAAKRRNNADRTPHVSYVTISELNILKGLSHRGVFFARKVTLGRLDVLNAIDDAILLNSSFPAGDIILNPSRFRVNDTSGDAYTRSLHRTSASTVGRQRGFSSGVTRSAQKFRRS